MGSRFSKRRRVGYRRRYRRGRQTRTRVFRRFRRRFRRARRGKSLRRFVRRVRGRRLNTSRKKISWIMAPTKTYTREFGQQHVVPNNLNNMECVYFTSEETDTSVESEDSVLTRSLRCLYDIRILVGYAFSSTFDDTAINTSPATANRDWFQGHLWVRGIDTYTIRNQSNEDIYIDAFVCSVRKNFKQDPSYVQNLYQVLGKGFQERGYDTGNGGAYNGGLTRSALSPFNSISFTRLVKVNKKYKIRIPPGKMHRSVLKVAWKPFQPLEYLSFNGTASETWTSGTMRYDYIRGERFMLFKLYSNPIAVTGQITLTHNIGQSQPGVIMNTLRRYEYKHMPMQSLSNIITNTPAGIVTGAGVIMGDDDFKEQAPAVAD